MRASDKPAGVEAMLEIGDSLREARSRRGLALADVEAATRIRVRYLEALERERFHLLPAGPYRRSFLREYAEFLGLDGDIYASEYDLRFAPAEPELPRLPPRRGIGGTPLLDGRRLRPAVAVSPSGTGRRQPTSPPLSQPRPRTHPHHPPTAQAPPKRPPPLLALTAARGSCWLSVRIGTNSGRTVYEQTLQQGQTVRFGLRRRLWIRLGAPWNLDATIGRRQVTEALPSRTGDTLATAAGLRPTS